MATHSSTLAWKIMWMEEPWQATVHGVARSQTRLSNFTHIPRSRNSGLYDKFKTVEDSAKLFSQMARPFYIPIHMHELHFPLLPPTLTTVCL